MAITTVSHPPQHAGDAQVKPKSAFGETRRTPWWKRGKNEPQATTVEHSPFPQPDAPTQVIPDLPHRPAPAPAAVPAAAHRDPSTSPDIVAVRMIRVCSQALDEHWTATRLHEALGIHNEELEKRWLRELDGARKVQARRAASEAQAARLVDVFEAAVLVEETTGTHVPLDPQAMGAGLAQMTANAHAPAEETMTFPRITDEMPDPRVAASSPVRTGRDQSAPPLPDAAGDTGAHEPLPQRPAPLDVLAAAERDQYTSVDPTLDDAELGYGSWVWDEGCGTTGPVWLKLARRHVEVAESGGVVARLDFVSLNLASREVPAGGRVRVLDPQRARELLAQHETVAAGSGVAR